MTHKNNIKYSLFAALVMSLEGCSMLEMHSSDSLAASPCAQNQECSSASPNDDLSQKLILPTNTVGSVPTAFTTQIHFQMLNDYVEQMALDLSLELVDLKLEYPIAVTSFVQLDATLNHADSLGNQLAESFITELRKVGLLVNDHKVMGNILVTSTGDFALSRDANNLKSGQNIGYVLTGTMVKNTKGMLINARIVGLSSNIVVAATSKLIPNIMLQELQ
jgi:TolB-like protein